MTWLDESHAAIECVQTGLVHVVNHTAAKVFELLKSHGLLEITQIISEECKADPWMVALDVREVLEQYEALGLIGRRE
jgi:hypothetical protein